MKPDFLNAHAALGIALKEQGKLDEAVASCRRALALKPDFPEVHLNLGIALGEQGKLEEAGDCYRLRWNCVRIAEADVNLGSCAGQAGEV